MAIEYTIKECEERIRAIDAQLGKLMNLPSQASVDGQFVSYGGRVGELQKERTVWERRLYKARSDAKADVAGEARQSSGQGPDIEVY